MGAEETDVAKLSDEELVRIIRTDDSELYEEIVKRYQDKLYRYLRYLTNQPHAIEDILQEVFIKAYRNLFGFNIKKKFSSWIYRIAHNEGVNHLKRTARRKYVSWEEVGTPVDAIPNSYEDNLVRKDEQRLLKECLDELDPKYREPLVLYYFDDKSYRDMSEILRVPVGTVGTLISRGKGLLRSLCEKRH